MSVGPLSPDEFESYKRAIRARESSNNYEVVNDLGYTGAYQFGAAALVDMGLVSEERYRSANRTGSWQKGFLEDESNWTIPGGQRAFLRNRQLQDQTFQRYTAENYNRLQRQGVLDGTERPQEAAGYLGVSHLLGTGTAEKYARGEVVGTDANGTTARSYYSLGAGAVGTIQVADAGPTPGGDPNKAEGLASDEELSASSRENILNPNRDTADNVPDTNTTEPEPFEDVEIPPKRVDGGTDANGRKKYFSENIHNVSLESKPNSLSRYASFTYNIALYQLSPKAYINALRSENSQEALNKWASRLGKTLIARSGGLGENISESFDTDFFIDNLEFISVPSPTNAAANTGALDMKFEIMEPRGATLIERMYDTARRNLGEQENWLSIPYLIELTFKGYDDNGRQINNIVPPKFFPIKITDLQFEIDPSGTTYKVAAVPFQQDIFNSIRNTIPVNVQLKAATVGDIFTNDAETVRYYTSDEEDTRLSDLEEEVLIRSNILEDNIGKSNLAAAMTYHYKSLTKPQTVKASSAGAPSGGPLGGPSGPATTQVPGDAVDYDEFEFMIADEIANARLIQDLFDPLNTGLDDMDDSVFKHFAQAIRGNVDLDRKELFRINAGTSLVNLVNFIAAASTYVEDNIREVSADINNPDGNNQPIKWFKLKPKIIDFKSWDNKHGRYKFKLRYDIVPSNIYYNDFPWADRSAPKGDGFHKKYDYIYSGTNTEVFEFKLQFNAAYYQTQQLGTGVPNDARGSIPATSLIPHQRKTQSGVQQGENIKSNDSIKSKRARDLMSTIMHDGSDLIDLKLKIRGDPDYLATGESSYQAEELRGKLYTEAYWPDGTINYDLMGGVFLQVNLKTPTDYNTVTGEVDLSDNRRYDTSAFSGRYQVVEIKSTFSGGEFIQELKGFRTRVQPTKAAQTGTSRGNESQTSGEPKLTATGTENSYTNDNTSEFAQEQRNRFIDSRGLTQDQQSILSTLRAKNFVQSNKTALNEAASENADGTYDENIKDEIPDDPEAPTS